MIVALMLLSAAVGVIVRGALVLVDEHHRWQHRRRSWL